MIKKFFGLIKKHIIITFIVVVALGLGGRVLYKTVHKEVVATSYVLGTVTRGTLINSISGSGQISAVSQVDVKPKSSGEVTVLYIKPGQEVKAGALLAAIDARDAQKSVRDAQTALQTAKLELEQLEQPLDELTLLQAQDSLTAAQESKDKSQDTIKKSYEDGFNDVANAFLVLPDMMTGLHDILFSNSINVSQSNIDFYTSAVLPYKEEVRQYQAEVSSVYEKARAAYDKNFQSYKSLSRFSPEIDIENIILQTYDTTKLIAEAVKSANNLIQFYQDTLAEHHFEPNSTSNTDLSSLNSFTGTTNSQLSSLLSIKQAIESAKQAIVETDRSIKEKELSLDKTKDGPDDLEVRAKKIAIQQKQDALLAAQQSLADYYVRAPFAGVIAKVDVKKGDTISSGSALATLVTQQKIAEISLNEVDVSKVKVGQKVTLTFDAIENLTIAGEVGEVDTLGTASQGVVTYNVKIIFDTQDERVKSGMSVSAVIVTDIKPDVLLVANSALKTQGDLQYVETLPASEAGSAQGSQGVTTSVPPQPQPVEIGLSNDTQTEITSGLNEGDVIVVRTITATTAKTTTQAPSLFGNTGAARTGAAAAGGGNIRFQGR